MVSSEAIKRLIQRGEGVNLEFKRRINIPSKIAKSLVAFANTQGGILLIGIDDNGYVYGVPDEKYPLITLKKIATTWCSPAIDFTSEMVELDGRFIIYANIPESHLKPHFVIPHDTETNTAYIRIENKSVEASPLRINLMRNTEIGKNYPVEIGEDERMLFAFLSQYGTITFEKYLGLSGLPETVAIEKLSRLISIGLLKSVVVDNREYFSMS